MQVTSDIQLLNLTTFSACLCVLCVGAMSFYLSLCLSEDHPPALIQIFTLHEVQLAHSSWYSLLASFTYEKPLIQLLHSPSHIPSDSDFLLTSGGICVTILMFSLPRDFLVCVSEDGVALALCLKDS